MTFGLKYYVYIMCTSISGSVGPGIFICLSFCLFSCFFSRWYYQ